MVVELELELELVLAAAEAADRPLSKAFSVICLERC